MFWFVLLCCHVVMETRMKDGDSTVVELSNFCSEQREASGIVYQPTANGSIYTTNCSLVANRKWTGVITRRCSFNETRYGEKEISFLWEDENMCQCIDAEIEIHMFQISTRLHYSSLIEISDELVYLNAFSGRVPNKTKILNVVHKLVNMAQSYYQNSSQTTTDLATFKSLLKVAQNITIAYSPCFDEDTKSLEYELKMKLDTFHIQGRPLNNESTTRTGYGTLIKFSIYKEESMVMVGNTAWQQYHQRVLKTYEDVVSVIIICLLILSLVILEVLKIKSSLKVTLHKNLILVYLLLECVSKIPLWISSDIPNKKIGCVTILILVHYHLLAIFTWMTVEGINLLLLVVLVFSRKRERLKEMIALGYGAPFVITGISIGAFWNSFKNTKNCLTLNGSLWILKAPIAVTLLVNNAILCLIIFTIVKRKMLPDGKKGKRMRNSVKAFVSLLPLLGGSFLIGLFLEYSPVYLGYIYISFNLITVVLLCIFHVALDPQVKKQYLRHKQSWINHRHATKRIFLTIQLRSTVPVSVI